MTPEQKLAAIIEAQVKGGFDKFDPFLGHRIFALNEGNYVRSGTSIVTGGYSSAHILEILIDPWGLRAAYGTSERFYSYDGIHATGETLAYWVWMGRTIARTWLETDGDAESTIDKAFSFLP